MIESICGTYSVARGTTPGGRMPRACVSSSMYLVKRVTSEERVSPFSTARLMILSSMSVMLRTYLTS